MTMLTLFAGFQTLLVAVTFFLIDYEVDRKTTNDVMRSVRCYMFDLRIKMSRPWYCNAIFTQQTTVYMTHTVHILHCERWTSPARRIKAELKIMRTFDAKFGKLRIYC